MLKIVSASLLTLAIALVPAARHEAVDSEMNARIRKEGKEHSHIMQTMHYLTDVYGPRLTGSPNHKAAAEWAIKQMTEWGLENGRLEPWDFGHPGWLNERFSGFIVSPVKDSLVGEVLAWTPSTKGTVTAEAVHVIPPDRARHRTTLTQVDRRHDARRLKGASCWSGATPSCRSTFTKAPLRRDDDGPEAAISEPMAPTRAPQGRRGNAAPAPQPDRLSATAIGRTDRRDAGFGGGAGAPERRGRDHRQIRAFNIRTFDLAKAVPTVVLRNEDYGRIARLLADNMPVRLEFTSSTAPIRRGARPTTRLRRFPAPTRKTRSSCSVATWTRGTARRVRPTTRLAVQ